MALIEQYKLSTYTEISVIAEDSSKKISLVMDEATNKLYVKKVLPGTDQFNFYLRLASLRHRNLIKIHDVICCDDSTHILEEYINGQTLQALLDNAGIQPENKVTDYIMQLCDALIYLHSQEPPIIHRDIKPENIMLTTDDVIKLVDFDIAREFKQSAKRDTTFMGTKEYAAPEQYGYQQTDGRTDIYAIGGLLHELLTGRLPQNNTSYIGTLRKIIKKCLRLEPSQRYQNVSALKKALARTRFLRYKKMGTYTLSAILTITAVILLLTIAFDYTDKAESSSHAILEQDIDALYDSGENDTIILTSKDGNFTVQIPSDWKEDNSINEAADLQASHAKTSAYFVFIADDKNDFDYTFEEWKEVVSAVFTEIEGLELSDEVKVTINGRPAIQQTISGIYDGIKIKSLLTYIDGLNYYGQILCGSSLSDYKKSLVSFEVITYSVKGL